MRISYNPRDRGYAVLKPWLDKGFRPAVTLDGGPFFNILRTADTDVGLVEFETPVGTSRCLDRSA